MHDFDQQQGKVTGENPEVPPAYPLENLSNVSHVFTLFFFKDGLFYFSLVDD